MNGRAVLTAALVAGCGSAGEGITGGTDAAACAACHVAEYTAWATSALPGSGTSPVFVALSASAGQQWGSAARARCVSCHQPGFGGDHGVGCVACHAATGNLAARDGLLVIDVDAPVAGPFANPRSTAAHGSRPYGFLESAGLCATCHEVTGPDLFHETTLDEYQSSSAGRAGLDCVSCHMPASGAGPLAPGDPDVRSLSDHTFVGLDPPWGADEAVAANAAQRTTQLLSSGLAMTLAVDDTGVAVTLQNNAGHAVPTGVAFLRRIWVDIDFTGADGATEEVPAVIDLGAQPMLAGVPVVLITQGDSVESHVLAPGASQVVHVDAPDSITRPFRATATLSATAVRSEVLNALGLSSLAPRVPTLEIAVVTAP